MGFSGMNGESSRTGARPKKLSFRQRHWESDSSESDFSDSEPEADYPMSPGVNQSQFTFEDLRLPVGGNSTEVKGTNSIGKNSINNLSVVPDDKSLDLNL